MKVVIIPVRLEVPSDTSLDDVKAQLWTYGPSGLQWRYGAEVLEPEVVVESIEVDLIAQVAAARTAD